MLNLVSPDDTTLDVELKGSLDQNSNVWVENSGATTGLRVYRIYNNQNDNSLQTRIGELLSVDTTNNYELNNPTKSKEFAIVESDSNNKLQAYSFGIEATDNSDTSSPETFNIFGGSKTTFDVKGTDTPSRASMSSGILGWYDFNNRELSSYTRSILAIKSSGETAPFVSGQLNADTLITELNEQSKRVLYARLVEESIRLVAEVDHNTVNQGYVNGQTVYDSDLTQPTIAAQTGLYSNTDHNNYAGALIFTTNILSTTSGTKDELKALLGLDSSTSNDNSTLELLVSLEGAASEGNISIYDCSTGLGKLQEKWNSLRN